MSNQQLDWPVDGHVHFHSAGRVAKTLDAAAFNFRAIADRGGGLLGATLLSQSANELVFESLAAMGLAGEWRFTSVAGEPESLIARRGGDAIALVCGRQVRAADGLEVLALGTTGTFPDGLPFGECIEMVRQSGAVAVLPWGFGKWLGGRGKRVAAALESPGAAGLFLGDNGSRLGMMAAPGLLRTFEHRGFRVLPGTDPFPFGGDEERVGRFGFLVDVEVPESAPWRTLRSWLEQRTVSPRPYGQGLGLAKFVFNQVGIQAYNRLVRDASS